jgi:hypothetical protein
MLLNTSFIVLASSVTVFSVVHFPLKPDQEAAAAAASAADDPDPAHVRPAKSKKRNGKKAAAASVAVTTTAMPHHSSSSSSFELVGDGSKTRLVCTTDGHNKHWEMEVDGCNTIVAFGKIVDIVKKHDTAAKAAA